MLQRYTSAWALSLAAIILSSCSSNPKVAVVDDSVLQGADQDQGDWLMYGRTYDDHRYSPLKDVNDQNVGKLGLAWSHDFSSTRGLEATPLVQDGVMYTTGNWSVAYAIDAKTGETKWTYDPKVDRTKAYFNCCDVVNRGVALYKGKVYLATLDGRLIALDENTGVPVWTAQTADPGKPYSITAAPRIAKGMVVVGNAGNEVGVRGYISAYDAESGKMAWRFYTVPGDPSQPFESKAMEAASKTWGANYSQTGGGGAPWEGMVYDPTLDLLYFGTGNPTAWYRSLRGKGDALYAASIIAVKASTGELAWYFQTTPSDSWDYDATQPLMQADLNIGGTTRKVIMQANKNGFFYVLDRATGEFISGKQFVDGVSWAKGLDAKGRPIENENVASGKPEIISPSPDGAHNWNPMAFSPTTGLVYFPAKIGTQFLHVPNPKWKYNADRDNLGLDMYDGPVNAKFISMPPAVGELLAWDPVNQKEAWSVKYPVQVGGGVLATAGNLVFQGRADGILSAYGAKDGKELWKFDAGTGIMAPPITYTVDGVQYVAVMAGWGGAPGSFNAPGSGPVKPGYGRLVTFKVDGNATLKVPAFGHTEPPPVTITTKASPAVIHQGELLFNSQCAPCHGLNAVAGPNPDLRYADKSSIEGLEGIVLKGELASAGMPSFGKFLTPAQVKSIQAYLISRIQESAKAAK